MSLVATLLMAPCLFGNPPAAELGRRQLVRHFEAKLRHPYHAQRIDGLAGLAHLGQDAAEATPLLLVRASAGASFERLVAAWALVKTGGPADLPFLEQRAAEERQSLLTGRFPVTAARVAFLATAHRETSPPGFLDKALPALYNRARLGDTAERLLAAWALYQIDTAVTRDVADEALAEAAASLDPGHGSYSRHLLYLRLIGPRARTQVAPALRSLIQSGDFGDDVAARRAQTLATLATLYYPEAPDMLIPYRARLRQRLDHPLTDAGALRDLLVLGPYGCDPDITELLRARLRAANDHSEQDRIAPAIGMCSRMR